MRRHDEDHVIRAADIAEVLHMARDTVYEMLPTGEIPSRRFGRRFIVSRAKFFEWLNSSDKKAAREHRAGTRRARRR